jgi:hypothetical protein
LLTGSLVGCGEGPATAKVSGEVKVNGTAVEHGVISYSPADNTGAPVSAEIRDGRYEIQTTAGPKHVLISVPVVMSRQKQSPAADAPWVERTAESLPEKYHSRSELTFEVQPGNNTKDWELNVTRR